MGAKFSNSIPLNQDLIEDCQNLEVQLKTLQETNKNECKIHEIIVEKMAKVNEITTKIEEIKRANTRAIERNFQQLKQLEFELNAKKDSLQSESGKLGAFYESLLHLKHGSVGPEPEPEPEPEQDPDPEPVPVPVTTSWWPFSGGSTRKRKNQRKRRKIKTTYKNQYGAKSR